MSFSENTKFERYLHNIRNAYAEDEARYESAVESAARKILEKRTVKMVFIAGASCSGKTPTTERLAHYLNVHGVKTELISLDDFYRDPHDNIYHADGTPDYESPGSLDLELLHGCFSALCEGRSAWMPKFDFSVKRRSDTYARMSLEDDELCIVEGLHALNYDVCGSYIDEAKTFKIYLDAQNIGENAVENVAQNAVENVAQNVAQNAVENVAQNTQSDGSSAGSAGGVGSAGSSAGSACSTASEEPRLLRRLVRDYYKRGATAELTLSMWDNVEEGSRKYIFPFRDDADVYINTYIGYERYVMRDDALLMLREVPAKSPYFAKARELILQLLPLPSLPKRAVAPHSLMREFVTL